MITIEDIRKAKEKIQSVAIETPLIRYSRGVDNRKLLFKPENLQPTGAFKIRGAFNKISSLSDQQKKKGVVAHSSGNHAQAVAYSAKKLGIKATIVMPQAAPEIKIRNTRNFGAEVMLVDDGAEVDMKVVMDDLVGKYGYSAVPPYEDDMIIAGQGTVGLEILDQCPDVDMVFVPIGGGGLIGGVSTYIKSLKPEVRVIGVEPELANDAQQSFRVGNIVSISKDQAKSTIADGLRPTRPGELTFPLIKDHVDDIITVSEDQILDATKKIITEARLMVEPSGAATFAAWLNNSDLTKPDAISVCVVSGGNIDPELLGTLLKDQS